MDLRRNSLIALTTLTLITSTVAATYADNRGNDEQNGGHGKIEFPLADGAPQGLVNHSSFRDHSAGTVAAGTVNQYGIQYHNGPILNKANGVNVYVIWYGAWGSDSAKTILPTFISGLNNSPYFAINSTYTDTAGVAITPKVNLVGQYSYPNTSTYGTTLSDANILALAKGSLGLGTIPSTLDANALYFVLTAPGIAESSGFLTAYCGWHSSETMDYLNTVPTPSVVPATDMKYSFVGDPGNNKACIGQSQTTYSPNSNVGADAMASVIAHELEETVTDPDGTAWWNSTTGYENGDQCAWKFGTTSSTAGTSSTLTGAVTAASNNGSSRTATVTGAKAASTGSSITFTNSGSNSFATGDKVSVAAPAPYAVSNAAITARTTTTFTVAATLPANTAALSGLSVVASAVRAGTTATYTYAPAAGAFAVGDKVSVAAPAPYALTNVSITAVTTNSFTVSLAVAAGTPTANFASVTAMVTRTSGSSLYNMTLGGLKFLIQQNWANRSPKGVCALS
jgi:hypothetical protein